jgi:hypothetical protein
MAQLGRLRVTVTKTNGQAVSGAQVIARRQGATIRSGGPNAFTVDDPGSFVAGNVAFLGTDSTPRSVTSVGETVINLGSTGFSGTSNNDRLTNNNLAALYLDAQGNQSTSNPMTTDSTGQVSVWAEIRPLDLHVSASGITAELRQDVVPEGHETITSNVHDGVTAIAYIRDTERALIDVNAIHTSFRVNGVEIAKLMADSELVLDAATIASLLGGVTITTGDLTVTAGDVILGAAVSQLVPGVTSFSVRDNADARDNLLVVDAGDVTVFRDFKLRRVDGISGTFLVDDVDITADANWGNTAAITSLRATDHGGRVTVSCAGTGIAADPTIQITFTNSYAEVVQAQVTRVSSSDQPTVPFTINQQTATFIKVQFEGTPVTGNDYTFTYFIVGP